MRDRGAIAVAIAIGGSMIALLISGSQAGFAAGETGTRLKCRAFPIDTGQEIDTRDPGSDLGKWVLDLEDRGWQVHDVEWEIGQKQTGYPQAWAHVCLVPL